MEKKNMVDYEKLVYCETIEIKDAGEDKIRGLFERALDKINEQEIESYSDYGRKYWGNAKRRLKKALKTMDSADVHLQYTGGCARVMVEGLREHETLEQNIGTLKIDIYAWSPSCSGENLVKYVEEALIESELLEPKKKEKEEKEEKKEKEKPSFITGVWTRLKGLY